MSTSPLVFVKKAVTVLNLLICYGFKDKWFVIASLFENSCFFL